MSDLACAAALIHRVIQICIIKDEFLASRLCQLAEREVPMSNILNVFAGLLCA